MSKLLFITRVILFHVIILLFYLASKSVGFHGVLEPIFILMLIIYEIIFIKDVICKNKINMNKKYNFLSILVFVIIIIILLRGLGDSHFIYYDKDFVKELYDFETNIYGYDMNRNTQFLEMVEYYILNNTVYFDVMFILLFIYRKIALKIRN